MKKQLKPLPTAVQVPLSIVAFLFFIILIGGASVGFMMGFYFVVSSLIFGFISNITIATVVDLLLRVSLSFVFLMTLMYLISFVIPAVEWISGLFYAVKKEMRIVEPA